MKRNTPQLWDRVWQATPAIEEESLRLAVAENSIRWQRIERVVLEEFASFRDLAVIEIGSGTGINAALMSRRGAKVTLLDYSEEALKRARGLFDRNGLFAEDFVREDGLSISTNLADKYDISMSFGLAEHFRGPERTKIIKAHFDVLRKGGLAFVFVPNKYNLPYRIFKFAAGAAGRWQFGEEYPFSRTELIDICRHIGITQYSISGGSLFYSFRVINRLRIERKVFGLKRNLNSLHMKKEKDTFFSQYLSHDLVLWGKKPQRNLL